ncbi:MAG: 4Fe-4S binding protein, partial [Betaproteobacteria bacterium]|nr:4Fe-4S binding protein [Betaproteobacteria bacterium]
MTGGGAGPRPFPIPVRTEAAARDWRRRSPWVARVEAFASRNRDRLAWVHVGMFFGFMALMVVPLFLPEPGDRASILNNFTLLANFVIWGLWFPLVFVSVIFTGRSWCGILCPLGASSEWANRIGLKR